MDINESIRLHLERCTFAPENSGGFPISTRIE